MGGRQEGGTLRQEEAGTQEGREKSRSLANSKKYSRVSRKRGLMSRHYEVSM